MSDSALTPEEAARLDATPKLAEKNCSESHWPTTFDFSSNRPVVRDALVKRGRAAGDVEALVGQH